MNINNGSNDYSFIVLDIFFINNEFMSDVRSLNLPDRDICEIYWQIIEKLYTHDDELTKDQLKRLPDIGRLMSSSQFFEHEKKESLLRKSVMNLGMQIHELIKNMGMYQYGEDFNYTVKEVNPSKLVLRRLFS